MTTATPAPAPTSTASHERVCVNCGKVSPSAGRRRTKGLLQALGWILFVPVVSVLVALIAGPEVVDENRFLLTGVFVVLVLPAGLALRSGFKNTCPVCGASELIPLSTPEGQRLQAEGVTTLLEAFAGHTDEVLALAVLDDGRLASGSWDKTVRIWDPAGRAEPVVLTGHTGGVTALAVLDDGRLASGSVDKTVRIWDPTGTA